MAERILKRIAHDQYITDLAIYTLAVNLVRALPDVRDGFKPASRRIIYASFADERAIYPKKVKSQKLDGDVMGNYHPHGNTYQTFKTLINAFEAKVPIMSGQGSFGTIAGDPPSAARYTECGLSPFGLDCIIGALASNKEVVDWNPTYTNERLEPQYLPVKVPILLVNGILGGIGTGVKADLPTHNLSEVIDATLKLIANPKADVVLIPDHCLPCDIIDTDWKNICNKGQGSYRARATMEVHYDSKDFPWITITSLPAYGTTAVEKKIQEGIASGKFPQIIDVWDNSSKTDVKIDIKLKKGVDINFVKEALYKYTPCEQSFRVNFEVVLGTELIRLSYKEYLNLFIDFAINNKIKEYSSRHYVCSTRIHRLDAFIKIVGSADIDKIIHLIKNRKETADNELIELLISKYKLTDVQASYIINAQLKQLSKGNLARYKEEFNKLLVEEKWLEDRISNDQLILADVREELLAIKAKYGTKRICNVIKVSNLGNIPDGNFKIIITENNYIRKIGENDIVTVVKGDRPKFVENVSNLENLLLFSTKGRVFKLPIHKIPIIAKSDPGIDIKTVIKGLTSDIVQVIYEPKIVELSKLKTNIYMAILSKNNSLKKLTIQDFLNVPPSGITYSKINPDDDIVSVEIVSDNVDIIMYSDSKALRISSKDISLLKRNAIGTLGMGGNHGPMEGIGTIFLDKNNPTKYIIVVTESGKVNKFLVTGFTRSQRNKAGNKVIDLGKNDKIHSLYGATDSYILSITTTSGTMDIPVKDIALGSSVGKGIKMISTKSDTIISVEMKHN